MNFSISLKIIFLFLITLYAPCLFGKSNIHKADTIKNTSPKPDTLIFSGSFDMYWRYSELKTASVRSLSLLHNSITPGWGTFGIYRRKGATGFKIKTAFGTRAKEFYADGSGIFDYIAEMKVEYQITEKTVLNFGLLDGFYGYEFNDPFQNNNYSVSYINFLTPAALTGATLNYSTDSGWSLMAGVFNNTYSRLDFDEGKVIGGQAAFENDRSSFAFSAIGGSEPDDSDFVAINLNGSHELSDVFAVGVDLHTRFFKYESEDFTNWASAAIYADFTFSDQTGLSFRGEYLADNGGFQFLKNTEIFGFTMTGNFQKGNLKFMPELRYDFSNKAVFPNSESGFSSEDFSFLIGLAYLF